MKAHVQPLCRTGFALIIGAFLSLPVAAAADPGKPPCRIAFDMGSTGIRAGTTESGKTVRRSLDSLSGLWAGNGMAALAPATISALRELPEEARFDQRCVRVGGGFSAWRLALQQDPAALVETLARIHRESGVAVLVLPANREGAYGHFAAKQTLGQRLTTSHVVDIGGGSLQIAGEAHSFELPLGQKSWHRLLCERLRDTAEVPCKLQPMDDRDLTRARALITVRVADAELPPGTTLTAISRPVSRGVLPALQHLAGSPKRAEATTRQIPRRELQAAIALLATIDLAKTAARTRAAESHAAYLLSDMLLVEGLMHLATDNAVHVAETGFSNIPGLLADDQAYAWHDHYACYLQRLAETGVAAYASDPDGCSSEEH